MELGFELDQSGGQFVQAIVKAVREDNEGVRVVEYPGYFRVTADDRLVLRKETVQKYYPYPFEMEDVQVYVSSYFGDIKEWSDEKIQFEWGLLE